MSRLSVRGRAIRTGVSRPSGAVAIALLVLLGGCSNTPAPVSAAPVTTSPVTTAPASAAPVTTAPVTAGATTVVIQNFLFAPDTLTVPAGATVTVINQDGANHTITANDGSFDTGNIAGKATGTFTAPSKPGTYPYKCAIHPFMTGTLTVT